MEEPLSLVKYWLEKIIIGLNLCPFAKIPYEEGLIRLSLCDLSSQEGQVEFFLDELGLLNSSGPEEINTTLIVYPNGPIDFLLFNDFIGELENLLEEGGLSSVFQVVGFHPEFFFQGLDSNHLANLVNRSPYPIVHILRSKEIARVIKNPKEGEAISMMNDKKLHALDPQSLDQLFYYLKK